MTNLKCPNCGATGDDLKLLGKSEGRQGYLSAPPILAYQCEKCRTSFTVFQVSPPEPPDGPTDWKPEKLPER